jgi:GNAT superfamily N-acetyltransferase
MIEFRRLTHEDYDDILDISKNIWDGTDYLPKVFHKWVDDKGYFLGAVDSNKNKVVAVDKLSILPDGTGWLEGLRVHIDYRGQKIGRDIAEEAIKIAKELLKKGVVNKLAFATHISNVESKTMMEKRGFVIKEQQLLAIKEAKDLSSLLSFDNFKIQPWDISYEEFKSIPYLKRRNRLLPLAFIFQEVTEELYEQIRRKDGFIKINGHPGIFKYKGEPNFIAVEDTFEGIDTFMNYCLLKYGNEVTEAYTPILMEDKELIEKLKVNNYTSWSEWQPDYLYYVYNGEA